MLDSELSALRKRISEMEAAHLAIEKRLERSLLHQKRLESRIERVEATPYFRVLRAVGRLWDTQKRRLGQRLLRSSLHPYYLRWIRPSSGQDQYAAWLEEARLAAPSLEWRRSLSRNWRLQPCVSIVLPIHNPRREWLQAAVDSVLAQSYENWQLCLCDDASTERWIEEYLCSLSRSDRRIQCARLPARGGISAALNQAGSLACGEYIGFLDHDDALAPHALHCIVEALQSGPADILYSDEDYIDAEGRPVRPHLKPGWSPELLLNCMYLGHFLVVSRAGIEQAGWFRSECDGAQDYDLALRMTDWNPEVRHVPEILYHWRIHVDSTASDHRAKPYAAPAALHSLSDAVKRRGWNAEVQPGSLPNTFWVKRALEQFPRASVIVCSRKGGLLRRCLASLKEGTDYPDWEIVIVPHTLDCDEELAEIALASRCTTAAYCGQFNFSRMNNLGAAAANGDVLIFMNDDVEPIRNDWLTLMVSQLAREDVGVVGPCLLYPSGMIQHAGLVLSMLDGVGHPGRRLPPNGSDFWPWLSLTRNVSAVTGACLGIRREVFERLGGLDTAFPNNHNDVDLCLRAAREGLATIYESRAVLRHKECSTRTGGTSFDERELFHTRWGDLLRLGDPYYSPSLRTDTEAAILRFPVETPEESRTWAGSR